MTVVRLMYCMFVCVFVCLACLSFSFTGFLLPFHGNRWQEDSKGFGIAVNGPPKGRFMRKSQLHQDLEVGRIETIGIMGKGMINHMKITFLIQKKYMMKKSSRMLRTT